MSWLITALNLLVNVLGVALALWFAFAVYRFISRGLYAPTGDPRLGRLLAGRTSRWSSRRVAAAWVDLNGRPTTRMAFLGCDETRSFELGEVTQALTGLLVADAVGRRELGHANRLSSLDDRLAGPLGAQTLESLVTHTSGLPRVPRSLAPRALASRILATNPYPRTGPDVVAVAARQPLHDPGHHEASVLGAALAGQLVAARAGVPFHRLLRERVLEPMGMVDTWTDPEHHRVKRGWTSVGRHAFAWPMDAYAPAAGGVTTLADMAVLLTALLRQTAPGRLATRPFRGVDTGVKGLQQATFWQVEAVSGTRRHMVHCSGQTRGYSAFVALFPEARRGIVVLSDTGTGAITQRLGISLARSMAEGEEA